MKARRFLIPLLALLCLCLAFALSGCAKYPEDRWLTDCLILNEEPEDVYEVLGTKGESEIASSWAVKRDGALSETGQYWLVCLFYASGAPFESGAHGNARVQLQFTLLQEMHALYNEECVEIGDIRGDRNISCNYNSVQKNSFDFQLEYWATEKNVVKGMLMIPFQMRSDASSGMLHVEVKLGLDGGITKNKTLDLNGGNAAAEAEISNMSVRYLTTDAYHEGAYSEDALDTSASFDDNGICYMVVDFTAKALEKNDGTHAFYVIAASPARGKMAIEIEEAPTGKIEETIRDGRTLLYGSYLLPPGEGEERSVRMIFSLRSISGGVTEVDLFVSGGKSIRVTGGSWMKQSVTAPKGELQFALNDDGRSYSVSDFFPQQSGSVAIPDTLGDGFPVTGIAKNAFAGRKELLSITIPATVTTIGERVFAGCPNLESIVVASDNPTYHSAGNCLIQTAQKLVIAGCKNSVLPSDGSVIAINVNAFEQCAGLTSLAIPDGVKDIGNSAFYGCSKLAEITIPDSVERIGNFAFFGCSALVSITIPAQATSIGEDAFSGCGGLESIIVKDGNTKYSGAGNCLIEKASKTLLRGSNRSVIPTDGSVVVIADSAFDGCSKLGSAVIPGGVKRIGESAFFGCSSLATVTIPNSVTVICNAAFEGCSSLTSMTVPNGVISICSGAFRGCDSLASITLPFIGDSANGKGIDEFDVVFGGEVPASLKAVVITGGGGVSAGAFKDCGHITSVTLPEGMSVIGYAAFENCVSLTHITIPGSVTIIGDNAFAGCRSLTSVIFKNTKGWECSNIMNDIAKVSANSLSDPSRAATYLKTTYRDYTWVRR